MQLGADEAGKGPVLGPMVAAAVRAPETALPDGLDDSKRLSPSKRESLADHLRGHSAVSVGVAVVTPERIDDPETDMNGLTVAAQAEALSAVAEDGDVAVVDAGDVDEARFGRRVRTAVESEGREIEVQSEHRADEAHPVVSAASVVAKVERDAHVERLTAEYGDVGSGYPSDPTTRTFLREYVRDHGVLPDCARASWQTCADVLAAAEQSALSEF
ncbi:ribonuclease HII [Haloprofundus marisrubri]|uniref:Ribonuclease HII n=1 Tax=Haloprofundus marisrubri TaxID=1514971 RepID=A0A0W1R6V7_9EURY|nr:ribonuclease HII [Haloprofundus marisrubri]KTG08945.1 ribonuclease HII [Haloprofundus marisrubri]